VTPIGGFLGSQNPGRNLGYLAVGLDLEILPNPRPSPQKTTIVDLCSGSGRLAPASPSIRNSCVLECVPEYLDRQGQSTRHSSDYRWPPEAARSVMHGLRLMHGWHWSYPNPAAAADRMIGGGVNPPGGQPIGRAAGFRRLLNRRRRDHVAGILPADRTGRPGAGRSGSGLDRRTRVVPSART